MSKSVAPPVAKEGYFKINMRQQLLNKGD